MSFPPRRAHERAAADAVPAGFFVMRTPLLPYDVLAALGDALESPAATDPDRLAAATAADRAIVRDRLRAALSRPAVREAISVASPSLAASVPIWDRDPDGRRGQQIERALYGYLARMAGRPTPGGLFAGWSTGVLAEETELSVAAETSCQRHTRLDAGFLHGLTRALGARPELRAHLGYRVSSSLYRAAGKACWAVTDSAGPHAHRLVATELTPYLEAVLQRAGSPVELPALAAALVELDPEIELDDAIGYVHELVDAQLLSSPLAPQLTGDDPLDELVEQLRACPELDDVTSCLTEARRALDALDRGGVGGASVAYDTVARALEPLDLRGASSRLVDVELVKPSPCGTLGRDAVAEILSGVEILRRLARPEPSVRRFVEAFVARYGDREVAMLEALDEDTGIGFDVSSAPGAEAAPLVAGLAFSVPETTARFGAREALLLRSVERVVRRSEPALRLSAGDLDQLYEREPAALPLSFAVIARIAAASPAGSGHRDFTVLVERVVGPSGANEIARCCRADPDLRAKVIAHLRAEEALRPDAVFADVVHLPAARLGNVLARPVLRGYELPYLARSGAPLDRQLPASDLVISIDPDGQIILRSLRLDREVIPRITAAEDHARTGSIGVYRFLRAVQSQGSASLFEFPWGPLEALAFLPRVTAGRVVLRTARWRLDPDQLRTLASSGMRRVVAVRELRAALGIPRCVELVEGERRLPLDLDNPVCVELFGHRVKGRATAVLAEQYPPATELCATGPDGRYVHDLVIPFVRAHAPRRTAPRTSPRHGTRDRFVPGSEWLQVQLYCATSTADRVLCDLVAPQLAEARSNGTITRWFFIRDADPDDHLCVRFRGHPRTLLGTVVPAIEARAADLRRRGQLWSLKLGAYQRETERYGGPEAIEHAEQIFQADSEAVLGILEMLGRMEAGQAEHARWQLALRGIDLLLDDVNLDLETKLAVLREAGASMRRMLGAGPGLDHQLGRRYRNDRPSIERVLDPDASLSDELARGIELLRRRSNAVAPVVRELEARAAAGRLVQPLHVLSRSYVHMFTNRLLRSAALAQELVLYDWLTRAYRSRLARANG